MPYGINYEQLFVKTPLLPQNPVGFRLCCRLLDGVDKLFREVDCCDQGFEFGGDSLWGMLSFAELFAQRVDLDASEDGFEGGVSIEQDLHVGGVVQVPDQRSLGEHSAQHTA